MHKCICSQLLNLHAPCYLHLAYADKTGLCILTNGSNAYKEEYKAKVTS